MSNDAIDLIREDLDKKSIPINELIELKNEIDSAIKILQDEMQENMIKEFREKAEANGLSLEEFGERLMKNIAPPEQTINEISNINPPKYKDPDSNKTWSGHGKNPKWFKEWKEAGKDINTLLIKNE